MFGKDIIIGHSETKIDSANRLMLPSYTHREPGDKIFIQTFITNNGYAIKLYSEDEFKDIITKLEEIKKTTTSYEELIKVRKELESVYGKLSAYLKVSKQNRITIPKYLMDSLNWESDKFYQCDGLGTSLLIRKK